MLVFLSSPSVLIVIFFQNEGIFIHSFFNKVLTVSSQTLLPSPETNRRLQIANDSDSSLNLHISCKIILSTLSDTFFGLPLLNLRLSKTCTESIYLTACQYRLVLKACVRYFHQICIFSPNDSPSKTMRNAFYFI